MSDKNGLNEMKLTEDNPSVWITTPHGLINIYVGFEGNKATFWNAKGTTMKKKTLPGTSIVTMTPIGA